MHRVFLIPVYKRNGDKIQEPVKKPFNTKFGVTILSWPMFNHLFPNLTKTVPFGYQRNVAMHFAVDMDIFHYFVFIGLQATIKIMQLNTRYQPGRSIEKPGGYCFRYRIMPFLFPTRN